MARRGVNLQAITTKMEDTGVESSCREREKVSPVNQSINFVCFNLALYYLDLTLTRAVKCRFYLDRLINNCNIVIILSQILVPSPHPTDHSSLSDNFSMPVPDADMTSKTNGNSGWQNV